LLTHLIDKYFLAQLFLHTFIYFYIFLYIYVYFYVINTPFYILSNEFHLSPHIQYHTAWYCMYLTQTETATFSTTSMSRMKLESILRRWGSVRLVCDKYQDWPQSLRHIKAIYVTQTIASCELPSGILLRIVIRGWISVRS